MEAVPKKKGTAGLGTTLAAVAFLTLLPLGPIRQAQDVATDGADLLGNAVHQTSDASADAIGQTAGAVENVAPGIARATSAVAHKAVDASGKAAVSTDSRQLRGESERWARYYARSFGIPVEFVEAIIDQESGWNPYALSPKGAAGLMQLMPETARRFRVRNRFRPQENIRGGVAYLALLSREFNGNLRLITAAYYAGEGQARFRRIEDSPPEVQAYVKKIVQKYRARRRQGTRPPGAATETVIHRLSLAGDGNIA